ncbi:MAG: SDR family oxidoreductase [Waterburya sp.]
MTKLKSLATQVVVVTGASRGIGAALAEVLARNYSGIRLVLASRNQSLLDTVATKCREHNAQVLIVSIDLSQVEQVQLLARQALEHYGRVDILINNAGYGQMGPVELIPPTAVQSQLAVNFQAPLILSQALIPTMRSQGGGKIINVSSLAGRVPFPTAGMYSCSKFALEALSDVMRMELKAFNIQVSVVEPGPVVTDFFRIAWQIVEETIPNYSETPYAPIFKNIEGIDQQLDLLGWSAEKTAKAIAKIIAKSRPKPRYVLATGGKTMIFIMNNILPTWARDEFWRRFYGIHKIKWLSEKS